MGIQAIWQAVRFHEGPGGTRTCPVCQVPCTWQHAVFDCQWWQDKGLSLPGWWNAQAQQDNTTFWARGLLAHTTQTPCLRRLRIPKWSRRGCGRPKKLDTDGLVFATDASGGEFTSDPRLRRVGVSVVALRKTGDSLKAVGKLCAQVPGAQTVFRGGLYAVGLLLRFTKGPLDFTLDCQGVLKRVKAPKPGRSNAALCQLTQDHDPQRIDWHWVPSHKDEATFIKKVSSQHLWRRTANDIADKACGEYTATLRPPARVVEAVRSRDALHQNILGHLSLRGQAILEARPSNQHPAYQKLASQPKPTPPSKDRVCRERIGSNVGRGHSHTVGEWFEALGQDQPGKQESPRPQPRVC